jgi:hypothetical protein
VANKVTKALSKSWNWLQGKKTTIATLSGLALCILQTTGAITGEQAILYASILATLGITANISNSVSASRAGLDPTKFGYKAK